MTASREVAADQPYIRGTAPNAKSEEIAKFKDAINDLRKSRADEYDISSSPT
jgi:hypothetical protein